MQILTSDDPKTNFIIDCATISAGTIAGLTGKTKYSEIDAILADWTAWLRQQPAPQDTFKNWRQAWDAWREIKRAQKMLKGTDFRIGQRTIDGETFNTIEFLDEAGTPKYISLAFI